MLTRAVLMTSSHSEGKVASSTHRGGGGGGYCGGSPTSHGAGGVNFVYEQGTTISNKEGNW